MVGETGDRQFDDQYNNSVLEIIYEDANDINSINTRLTLLIGFNATFVTLLPKLPIQSFFFIKDRPFHEFDTLYSYAKLLLKTSVFIINWLLTTKPLIALLVGASIALTILSVLPSSTPVVILPQKMLEKGKNCSEADFRIGIIKNRNETIQRLQSLIKRKAMRLRSALMALGGAALLTVFDILTNSDIQPD